MNVRLPFSDARRTAHEKNPLIGGNPAITIDNAACVADLLARLHSDQALSLEAEDAGRDSFIAPLTASQEWALVLVAETLAAALRFEVPRGQS